MFAISGVQYLSPEVGKLQENMPAAAAGLEPGDLIVSIDGHPVKYFEDILENVSKNKGTPIDITVNRGNQSLDYQITPQMVDVPNLFGETTHVARIGIESSGETITERINPFTALYYGVIKTYDLTRLTILSVVKMIQGKVSAKNLGGPIFIVQLTHQEASRGVVNLVFLAALLSLNLGNPEPPAHTDSGWRPSFLLYSGNDHSPPDQPQYPRTGSTGRVGVYHSFYGLCLL